MVVQPVGVGDLVQAGDALSSCECIDASCSTTRVRRARKPHVCEECGTAIAVGEQYRETTGVWDRRPDRFRIHLACAELHREYERRVREGQQAELYARIDAEAIRSSVQSSGRALNGDELKAYLRVARSQPFDMLCDCIPIGGLREALGEYSREVLGYDPDARAS